jgi:hypothetical protein
VHDFSRQELCNSCLLTLTLSPLFLQLGRDKGRNSVAASASLQPRTLALKRLQHSRRLLRRHEAESHVSALAMHRRHSSHLSANTLACSYRSMGDHTETTEIDFDPSVISYEQVRWFAFPSLPPHCLCLLRCP